MAKTRRIKRNTSPGKPYRNAKAFIAAAGDMITTTGVRGRTKVKRVVSGGRLHRIREVDVVPQIAAKPVGERKPTGIFVGRQYTGVARSKPYPYRGVKRGAVAPPLVPGLMQRAAKAIKRVVVRDALATETKLTKAEEHALTRQIMA